MTNRRRYLISAAVLAACVCIALGVLAMLPAQSGVTKENFDRIEKGMALKEVEENLGKRPIPPSPFDHEKTIVWFAHDGSAAWITFENDAVDDFLWVQSPESIPDKLRRWLHLPK